MYRVRYGGPAVPAASLVLLAAMALVPHALHARVVRGHSVTCTESQRRIIQRSGAQGGDACHNVVWVLDGIATDADPDRVRSFRIDDLESIAYLPPAEARWKFGIPAGSVGAVMLWTRGHGPHVSPPRGAR